MSEDADLLRVLAGLRAQYLAESPERLAGLQAALARVRAGDAAALADLRLLLHRLAGSGGSYGLQAVTDAARAGELVAYQLLDRGGHLSAADADRLAELLEGVANAFRESGAADRGA